MMMKMTFVEKLLAKYAGEKHVKAGQIVTVQPDHLLMHDNAAPIISKIQTELEHYGVFSKDLPVIVLDHVIPAAAEKNAAQHKKIREFVNTQKIKNFFDVGCGVCHQIIIEKSKDIQKGVCLQRIEILHSFIIPLNFQAGLPYLNI